MKTTTLLWLFTAALVACGGDVGQQPQGDAGADATEDATQDSADTGFGGSSGSGGSGGVPTCPIKASVCPEECTAILGGPVDLVNECLLPGVTIGCWLPTGVGGGLIWCVMDTDTGVPYVTGAGHLIDCGRPSCSDDWMACPQDAGETYTSMGPCL